MNHCKIFLLFSFTIINVAIGSITEIETQLLITFRLKYINEENKIFESVIDVRKLLLGFRNYLNKK